MQATPAQAASAQAAAAQAQAPSAAGASTAAAAAAAPASAASNQAALQQQQQQMQMQQQQQPDHARALAAAAAGPASRSLVVDLGGDTIKVGWAGQRRPNRLIPNCAVKHKRDTKWLVGDQMLPEEVLAPLKPGMPPGTPRHSVRVPKITDYSGLYVRRPHDRGFVVNWDLENQVLSRAFHRSVLDPAGSLSASAASTLLEECSMLVTLPLLAPPLLAKDLDENMLEKWGVARYRRVNSAALAHRAVVNEMYSSLSAGASAAPGASSAAAAAAGASPLAAAPAPLPVAGSKESLHRLCAVVVDSGYSFTHIMPVYQGRTIKAACKRVNVGGKLLTNYLKEMTSYRAWNMMDETWIINDVKEKLCYVSTDFERELQAAKRSRKVAEKIRREYVLPNGSTVLEGYVKTAVSQVSDDEQVLQMGNERLCVPEVLFTPSDIGLAQAGLVESIAASVALCPAWMQGLMYDNIVLVGGNARLPNFQTRVERELRGLVPQEFKITVRMAEDPVTSIWQGGSLLASDANASSALQYVTKAEFHELGSEALTRKWEGDDDDAQSMETE